MVACKISENYFSYEFIGLEQRLVYNSGKLILEDLNSKKVIKEFAGEFHFNFKGFEITARDLYSDFISLKTVY